MKLESHKTIVGAGVAFLSLFLVFFHFLDTPKVWVDEGVFTEVAKNMALHGVIGIQTSPGVYFPMNNILLTTSYPVIAPIAGMFYLFGVGLVQARLIMVFYMLLLLISAYLLSRAVYGFVPAVMTVLLILSFSPFYGNGRPVQGEVPGIALFVLGLFMIYLCEKKQYTDSRLLFISGAVTGLAASVKPLFLVGISFALVIGLIAYYRKISDKKKNIIFYFRIYYSHTCLAVDTRSLQRINNKVY